MVHCRHSSKAANRRLERHRAASVADTRGGALRLDFRMDGQPPKNNVVDSAQYGIRAMITPMSGCMPCTERQLLTRKHVAAVLKLAEADKAVQTLVNLSFEAWDEVTNWL